MTKRSQTHQGFVPVPGTELFYEVQGEGPPLVLVHAGIADHRMWDAQVAHFSDRHRVIRYDVRGFGRSMNPAGEYADHEDLLAVFNHLGIEKAALVGASNGGRIAIDFALTYPQYVQSLVLAGASVGGFEYSDHVGEGWELEEEALERGDIYSAAEINLRMWVDGPYRRPHEVDLTLRERVREMLLTALSLPPGMDEGEARRLQPPAIERLHEIHSPTLAIVGALEYADKLKIGQLLETAIPRARLVVMADTAHMPSMERPDEFNRLLAEFLQDLNQPASLLTGLDHVQIAMPPHREDEARQFYGELLGLTEIPRPKPLAGRGGCWFQGTGIQLHLGVQQDFVPATKAHPAFRVADLEALRQRLESSGIPVIPDDNLPGVRRFYAADPFGNRIEFMEDR